MFNLGERKYKKYQRLKLADLCGLTLRFLHCGVLRFVIAACRVMRFIQSVISLKRSRVRAYSTVMRGSSLCRCRERLSQALIAGFICFYLKDNFNFVEPQVHMVRAEIAPAAYPSETDGNYVLAVRDALSDILFWALPDFIFIAWIGLCYCAGYIHGILRSIR